MYSENYFSVLLMCVQLLIPCKSIKYLFLFLESVFQLLDQLNAVVYSCGRRYLHFCF